MDYQNVINFKLNTLIDLMLTRGVSPSDLADNIFEKDYISVSFSKANGHIIGKLNFYDAANMLQNIFMIYTYTADKELIRIEEIVNNSKRLMWDRENREEELIDELIYFMNCCYGKQQIEEFISSLPEKLKSKVVKHITISA